MSKIIIVSNRLPVSIKQSGIKMTVTRSSGGLASGMAGAFKKHDAVWVGWPGAAYEDDETKESVRAKLEEQNMYPVFLDEEEQENFYEGYSNSVLWPAFHYFTQYVEHKPEYFEYYKRVNKLFADAILEVHKLYVPGDMIWIHDYHLMLLPEMLRAVLPDATIGFFLHIPFPAFEIFRTLPERKELAAGLLGSDLIGFHTYSDVRYFTDSTGRLLGHYPVMNELVVNNRTIQVDIFPIGIDYDKFYKSTKKAAVQKEVANYKELFKDKRLILSVDRLDFSKGIIHRLRAYQLFLEENPEYTERVCLVMVVVPSRDNVQNYFRLKREIDELVGNINSKFGTITWTPIYYFYKSFNFDSICAFYDLADVALVTPLRDGMNLVCKEYVACCIDHRGVLVLSEMAGAAKSLAYAVRVNPYDIKEVADSIKTALEMPEEEQAFRLQEMQKLIKQFDSFNWFATFYKRLLYAGGRRDVRAERLVGRRLHDKILSRFTKAKKRLIFLDYDGTLVGFAKTAMAAKPDKALITLLTKLVENPDNTVAIITGRNHKNIEDWLPIPGLHMIAEHGIWRKKPGEDWASSLSIDDRWKTQVAPIFEEFENRTPGAYIEKKPYSLVWHYRQTDNELGELRARELTDTLQYITANLGLQVLQGKKVIEVKDARMNKGIAASEVLHGNSYDITIALGDDETDEDIFRALTPNDIRIKVGEPSINAEFWIESHVEVRQMLQKLIEADGVANVAGLKEGTVEGETLMER